MSNIGDIITQAVQESWSAIAKMTARCAYVPVPWKSLRSPSLS